jgi:uncharacterized membrane protein YedE/YeeE
MEKEAGIMFDHFFADPQTLMMGALTGFVFGFLLQKGGATRFKVILGQFLLKDFTVLKIMLTAIVVGSVGIYGMRALGVDFDLHIKSTVLLGNALGGLIFGAGMAVLGYCPGTCVAALGDGSKHAIAGVLGMIVGAALFAEVYPLLSSSILRVGSLGKSALHSITGFSPWGFIIALVVLSVWGFWVLERWERKKLQKSMVPNLETRK